MHVGDFKSSHDGCSDELFLQRRDWFGLSLIRSSTYRGTTSGSTARVAVLGAARSPRTIRKLRELFFASHSALGQRRSPSNARQAWVSRTPARDDRRGAVRDAQCAGPNNTRHATRIAAADSGSARVMREAFRIARDANCRPSCLACRRTVVRQSRIRCDRRRPGGGSARYKGEVLVSARRYALVPL